MLHWAGELRRKAWKPICSHFYQEGKRLNAINQVRMREYQVFYRRFTDWLSENYFFKSWIWGCHYLLETLLGLEKNSGEGL